MNKINKPMCRSYVLMNRWNLTICCPVIRSFILTTLVFAVVFSSFGQKLSIDSSVYDSWPILGEIVLSDDGKFVSYNVTTADFREDNFRIICSLSKDWKVNIPVKGYSFASFMCDNKMLIFAKSNDSLAIVTLDPFSIRVIPGIKSYNIPKKGEKKFIAYQLDSSADKIFVRNLLSGHESIFSSVKNYLFDNEGTVLLTLSETQENENIKQILSLVEPNAGQVNKFWEGKGAKNFAFDKAGKGLAFFAENSSLWYYNRTTNQCSKITSGSLNAVDTNLRLSDNYLAFTNDGSKLYFYFREKEYPKKSRIVNVWSYRDAKLQSQQLTDENSRSFLAAVEIKTGKIMRLESMNDKRLNLIPTNGCDNFIVTANLEGDFFFKRKKMEQSFKTVYISRVGN